MRREKDLTIESDPNNRDAGKVFHLTEMSALRAERWAFRMISAAAKAGVDIGTVDPRMGMQGIAVIGLKACLMASDEELQPLLAEMLSCVTVPTAIPGMPYRPLTESDVEEVSTFILLRMEVVTLHVGFSLAGAFQKSAPATNTTSSTTSTSPQPSPPPSIQVTSPGLN